MQNEKEKFKEDFVKRLIRFSVKIIKLCETMRARRILWPVVDQVIRSATSVGANVVEAKSSSSRKDYLHFFEIALKSANETKYWLCLLRDSNLVNERSVIKILDEVVELSNMIGSSLLTMKSKEKDLKL